MPTCRILAEQTGGIVSDSLDMANFGHQHPAKTIVVAGVRFMGETAKILNPEKRVLMPDLEAECSLDLGCPVDEFTAFCDAHPDRTVVVYANTSAAVKARADWMVTSSIALPVVKHLMAQGKKILWAPDRHLGDYVQQQTGADMLLWQGSCIVHDEYKAKELQEMKAQHPGGKPYRQTPVFASKIDQVVFNPTWTVPPTILSKDILPQIKRNPGYLASKKLEVLDRNGNPVDPAAVDWSRLTARNFPYTLRQGPGPDNALGRVKFLFPNPYSVYLHDTPSKALFEKEDRAFSSGCIRVQRPLELAELLLKDPKTWNSETIARTIEAGVPTTARVSPPVPVLLMYWTIVPSDDGHTVFKRDPYRRDPRLATALDAPFRK